MSMKAAVYLGNGSMAVQSVPIPQPGADEVLVKVSGCGVCATDVHIFNGFAEGVKPPVALGHEIGGVIEKLGEGAGEFQVGTKVAIDPTVTCGTCEYCLSGRNSLCEQPTIIGYSRWGGFAQYCVAPKTHVYPMSDQASVGAGVLAETLACVLTGFDRLNMTPSSNVLLVGAGTVGLLWNNLVKNLIGASLVQVELVQKRAERAKRVGADAVHIVGTGETDRDFLNIYKDGFDIVVDCAGTGKSVQFGLDRVSRGGVFLCFGVCDESDTVTFSPLRLLWNEINILTAKMTGGNLGRAVKLVESDVIAVDQIVTSSYGLEDVVDCLGRFKSHRESEVKMVIDPYLQRK